MATFVDSNKDNVTTQIGHFPPACCIPDDPLFDQLRKTITKCQDVLDKTFGPGTITATIDVSELIASDAWADMDKKTALVRLGNSLWQSVDANNGLSGWAVKGLPDKRRNKDNVSFIKEDILANVKTICIRVDLTNNVQELDAPKGYVASLDSNTKVMTGVRNIDQIQRAEIGYAEKLKKPLSGIVMRAHALNAVTALRKTDIPNYIKNMALSPKSDIHCTIRLDDFINSDEFRSLAMKNQEEKVQRLKNCFVTLLKNIVSQSKKDSAFMECASTRVGSISIGYDPTSSIKYKARNTNTTVTWTAELIPSDEEGGEGKMHLLITQNLSETRGMSNVKEILEPALGLGVDENEVRRQAKEAEDAKRLLRKEEKQKVQADKQAEADFRMGGK